MIELKNISKKYKGADYESVSNLSLNIHKGDFFGLLGPNGAGKTTLISMMCGLISRSQGELKITGLDFKHNKKALQQIIGVVPQEYALYPTLTAYENLLYFGAMQGVCKSELSQKINDALKSLGLSEFANKKIKTFSGGMKRRVNLIAGILHNPEILFLDEPTVGVDVQSKASILQFLKEMNANGTTIIYTSHHLHEAQDLCNEVAILDRGTIIAKGTPEELIKNTPDATRLEDVFIILTGGELRDYV